MKRLIITLLLVLITIMGCSKNSEKNEKNILSATLSKEDRRLTVDVTFANGSIVDIQLSQPDGWKTDSENVARQIANEIISRQSLSVDMVAGATASSQDVIEAVSIALEKGGISSDLFKNNRTTALKDQIGKDSYDVIVIGSGAAGLAASLQAAWKGNTILLLEKMPIAGGSSYMSGAEMAIPENVLNIDQSQDDSPKKMIEDIVKTSQYTADKKLVSVICYNIAETALWLQNYVGAEFNNEFYMVNGHSIPRVTFPDGGGANLITLMVRKAEEEGVHILYNTDAKHLIRNEKGEISGVHALHEEDLISYYATQRVIITTGGFSANKSMCEENNDSLKKLEILSSGPQGNTGDGITMGREIGAATVGMNNIQLYPYTNPATGIHFYMDNKRRDAGALYINREGKRFVREDLTRIIVSAAVLKQPDSTMYEVFTEEILNKFCTNELALKEFNQWVYQGVIAKGDSIAECADFFSLDKKEVTKTLNRYNAQIKSGEDEDFGRQMDYSMLDKGPYYMLEGVPSIHYTLGGLKIDEKARVLDEDDRPIPHLYAAGEVTGGIFGRDRLGACAIPDALVFGRIAGGYEPK